MKRGQKVRILRTNQIATVADIELVKKDGKVHRYCHLKTASQPDLWMDASQLGGVEERCTLISRNGENGQELCITVIRDYCKGCLNVTLTGKNPENLKEHRGLHVKMAMFLIKGMKEEGE